MKEKTCPVCKVLFKAISSEKTCSNDNCRALAKEHYRILQYEKRIIQDEDETERLLDELLEAEDIAEIEAYKRYTALAKLMESNR